MSGLCGIVQLAGFPRPEALRSMCRSSAYRGPDGVRVRRSGEAAFSHLALHSTPEAIHEAQPLENGRVLLVADARIDNRSELAGLLSGLPAGRPPSDAEIILAAYLRWGEDCVRHLLGDFAFALWDAAERRLVCAVDPLGVKPFYYALRPGFVCFGSDAFQLLRHPGVPRDLDEEAVADYLAGLLEDSRRSFFREIHRLPAGHCLTVTPQGASLDRYWSPRLGGTTYRDEEDYGAHFLDLFRQSVADRLRTQAPCIGVAMSGGLDSCSVAAVAHRVLGSGSLSLAPCSFIFPGLADCDESAYIRAMESELGLESERIDAVSSWRAGASASPSISPDTPFLGWPACYGRMLERLKAKGARVLLMGHGGDDLLRGSALAYADRLRRGDLGAVLEVARHARERGEPLARTLYRYLGGPLLPPSADGLLRSLAGRQARLDVPGWISPGFVRRTHLEERLRSSSLRAGGARQDIFHNTVGISWYSRIVHWHDRNAAAFGIEVRHPFLDRRLFEYVLSIPPEQLFRLGTSKLLLRRAMVGILPEAVHERRTKTRFTSFLHTVLAGIEAEEVEASLREPLSSQLGILEADPLRAAYKEYRAGTAGCSIKFLWHAVTLERWLKQCRDILRVSTGIADSEIAA